jgi:hypothetical protein
MLSLNRLENEISKLDLNELAEILVRGYLRILLSEGERKQQNLLKRLDKQEMARDELDR